MLREDKVVDSVETRERRPLSRERVLRAAVELADREGVEAISLRRLGQELGVEAMAIYRHVRDKDDIVDGAVDAVVGEIEVGEPSEDWQAAMRALAMAARSVMLRHRWAPAVIVTRQNVGPAMLGQIERVLQILRRGGFTIDAAHHAVHVLGSRILGFTQDPFNDSAQASGPQPPPDEVVRAFAPYPAVAELAVAARHDGALGGCDDDFEFEFGLDLVLDGLDRRRASASD